MNTKDEVLAVLGTSDDYVSGEKMSEIVGVSRMAINSAVKSLRESGYIIKSSTNRGYMLESSPDIISCGALSLYLPPHRADNVICLKSVDSTNNYLRTLAIEGKPHGTVAIAESQSAGRGRMGRSFASPESKGVYLSMLIRPEQVRAEETSAVSAWVAVAIRDAVARAYGVDAGIKWVNDLTLGNKKICGILTEMSIESETGHIQYMVVGAGVNVNETEEDFPKEFRSVATSLKMETAKNYNRVRLAAEMIKSLDKLCSDFPSRKQYYLDSYRKYNVTTGKDVRLISGSAESVGFAKAIDDDFALVVETDGKEKSVHSGEVSVRGLYGYV